MSVREIGVHYIEDVVDKQHNPNTESMAVRLRPELVERLDRIATEVSKTRAEVVRDLLDEGSQEIIAGMAERVCGSDREKLDYIWQMVHGQSREEVGA